MQTSRWLIHRNLHRLRHGLANSVRSRSAFEDDYVCAALETSGIGQGEWHAIDLRRAIFANRHAIAHGISGEIESLASISCGGRTKWNGMKIPRSCLLPRDQFLVCPRLLAVGDIFPDLRDFPRLRRFTPAMP